VYLIFEVVVLPSNIPPLIEVRHYTLEVFGLCLFLFFESALLLGVTLVIEPSAGLQRAGRAADRYIGIQERISPRDLEKLNDPGNGPSQPRSGEVWRT
jgi:hypothetical protein